MSDVATNFAPLVGSCLCGAVRYEISAPLADASACHCVQCRKQTGQSLASANVAKSAVTFTANASLKWFQSSEKVRRGFCGECGSVLFWEPLLRDWTSVVLGAIDGPTGVKLERHIFVSQKGDYYDIADGLPQNER
jgi:hypothetical protein